MNAQVPSESRVCPDCDCATLSDADGVLGCTNCGWSEEDESGFSKGTLEMLEDAEHEDYFGE